ncbi:MAG: glycoside hydrolase family 5 protein, partial [Clostridiales bacterium]|nr:glycoside hydrolase family 5 protein [Clostridiales bacterium]
MNKIGVSGCSFIDETGRERIFNGVNLIYKGNDVEGQTRRNYYPNGWNDELFAKLEALGINLVRLGLIWDGVEPEPGVYDEEYLDFLSGIADKLKEHNIYFYLDMHQDLYSHVFGGDGAPAWAVISDSYKYRPAKFIWAEGYFFSKAVHRSFDHFWNNDPILGKGLQDWFADMWKHVAERFKDKENLLGYDIFNEPFPGTDGGKTFKAIVKSGVKTVMSPKIKKIKALKNIITGDTFSEALAVIDDRDVFRSITKGGDLYIK